MWPRPHFSDLVVRIPLMMLGVVFLVEAAIMTVFAATSNGWQNRWVEVFVDSTVLTLTVAPLLYWLIVRPLRVLADERSQLLARAFEIQEAERQQVARDLHDEIGQSFTSLLVQLRVLEESPTLAEAKSLAREVRDLSGHVYDQIRSLARGLYPTVLDDLGLIEALSRLVEDFETTHRTSVMFKVTGLSKERLNRKVEAAAYRIVQESLTNCAKHAQAASVDVSLIREPKQLVVRIADDGRGFDAAEAVKSGQAARFGITNMRERALLLNGSFAVQTQPGSGTTITARLPLGS